MGVQALANTIARLVKNKAVSNTQNIKRGIIAANRIIVDGNAYNYSVAVDVPIDDGDYVYVIFNDTGTRAVVIGK